MIPFETCVSIILPDILNSGGKYTKLGRAIISQFQMIDPSGPGPGRAVPSSAAMTALRFVPRGCNCASQTGKVRSTSIQTARQRIIRQYRFCNPAACFEQNTFHSRMSDVACSLALVWTVQTICPHRPYCPTAHCLHCLPCWKVFFRYN